MVLGVGMSSDATPEEVGALAGEVVRHAGLHLSDVGCIATRMRFVADHRVRIGPPVVGVEDLTLLDRFPRPGRIGFAARVAEGCALVGAGCGAELLVGTVRSAHATAALAVGRIEGEGP
ncbi:MAG: cobalamin biosynthesis protein [Acidimicrobiales bacterium]